MENVMITLEQDKRRLFKVLNSNPKSKETIKKIREINNLMTSINNVIKVGIRPSKISEEEFNELKKLIYSDPVLDAVMPLVFSLEIIQKNSQKELI